MDDAELKALADKLRDRYDRETDIRYAAARGWIDAIIDPSTTRETLIQALDVATRQPAGRADPDRGLSGLDQGMRSR